MKEALSRWVGIALSATLLALTCWRFVAEPVSSGLDPSYRLAFNLLAQSDLRVGREILFTYGPWGFVLFPQPMGLNVQVANLLGLAVLWVVSVQLLALALPRGQGPARERWTALALAALAAGMMSHLGTGNLLFCATYLGVLLRRARAPGLCAGLASVVTLGAPALAFMIKPAYGILAATLVLADLVLESIRRRRPWPLLLQLPLLGAALLALWISSGAGPMELWTFLQATCELARGNASAMSLNPQLQWYPLAALVVWFCWLAPARLLPWRAVALLALPALTWSKYALARPDHAPVLLDLSAMLLVPLVLLARGWRLQLTRVSVVALTSALVFVSVKSLPFDHLRRLSLGGFWARALDPTGGLLTLGRVMRWGETRERFVDHSRSLTARHRLSPKMLVTIGGHSVDTYPWNVSYIYANDLRWRPRPVFQSYLAYTPWLDHRNAQFFHSPSAPAFVIWEIQKQGGPLLSIDQRYLPNDEPLTMAALVTHYRMCRASRKVALLQRVDHAQFREPRVVHTARESWNKWILVPDRAPGTIVRARIGIHRTLYGWARRVLYKEKELFIYYRLQSGRVRRFRLVPDQAGSGVWASPYLPYGLFDMVRHQSEGPEPGCPAMVSWPSSQKVHAIRLQHRTLNGFEPHLDLAWEELVPVPEKQ